MNGGYLVREARHRAGLSQAALAARVGTTQSAIARVEGARQSPTLEYLERLVRGCGFSLDVRLVPYDDHDWTLAEENRRLTPEQRLGKMLATAQLGGSAHPGRPQDR